jgi:hypothetical protein
MNRPLAGSSPGLGAWSLIAEERILAAQKEGQFDHLPGFGKPLAGIDEFLDELWWVREKLRREGVSHLPPALALRLDRERTLARIAQLPSESLVRQEIEALNDRIRQGSFAAWGPPVDVVPLDVEATVAQWRSQHGKAKP